MDGYESISREFPINIYQISILHGRMKSEDKAIEMKRLKMVKLTLWFQQLLLKLVLISLMQV